MLRGVVERVNWQPVQGVTDGTVDVALPNGISVAAAYLSPWPPIPRSIVWVQEALPGAWVVVGAENAGRPLFHDDFMWGSSSAAGDTTWDVESSGTTTQGTITAGDTNCYGQARLTITTPGSGVFRALTKPSMTRLNEGSDIYLAARIDNTTGGDTWLSYGNTDARDGSAYTNIAFFDMAFGAELTFLVGDAAGALTRATFQDAIVAAQFYVVEMLVSPGRFVAAWVDGVGPLVPATYIDAAGNGAKIGFGINSVFVANARARVDWIHAEVPGLLVPPGEAGPWGVAADEALSANDYGSDGYTVATDAVDIEDGNDPSDLAVGDA